MRTLLACFSVACGLFLFFGGVVAPVHAADVLGVHILNTGELNDAATLLKTEKTKDSWDYVTIPFTFSDIGKKDDWNRFFLEAKDKKFQPIVRLTTRFENGSWVVPTRKDITDMVSTLSSLSWPQEERLIVLFNEPNHKNEWGGTLDPEGFAEVTQFAADWLHSENAGYVVLPAGLDLAAPNGPTTMEAFVYLRRMIVAQPRLLESLDGWTSHSYPNPAFSASPKASGKNTLRGFEYELAFLKTYTDKEFPVYITETGWVENATTARWLSQYYQYAKDFIWSDPRVRAVTPFVLRGDPGSFAQFSFLDRNGKPTRQFYALKRVIE